MGVRELDLIWKVGFVGVLFRIGVLDKVVGGVGVITGEEICEIGNIYI